MILLIKLLPRNKEFSVGRGKWNLEVTTKAVENIEKSFSAPAVEPQVQQNLVPETDDTFVKFGPFNDLKKLYKASFFILLLLLVYQGTVRPLV